MRIKLLNSELIRVLNNVGKVISTRPAEPILENVLLRVDDKITFISTNLEQGIECTTIGEINLDDGVREAVLPFSITRDIISSLNMKDVVELEISSKKGIIRQNDANYSLNCFSSDSFAILPKVEEKLKFSIEIDTLKDLIDKTSFAASKKDESRKEFKGIYFDLREGILNFVATDSTALVTNKRTLALPDMDFIIPSKALDILSKLDIGSDKMVDIISDGNSIQFQFSNLNFVSLLINGKFPDYEAVIPQDITYTAEVEKDNLLKILKRVNIIASKTTERLNLMFSGGFLQVKSISSDIGEGEERIKYNGNVEMSLQFYAEKLISGVEHTPGDIVVFGINGPLHPVLINGKGDDSYIFVVMPQKPLNES